MLILIVGTGSIGKRHVANIQIISPDTKFQFVFLRKDGYQDDLSLSLGGIVFSDIEEALQLKPDCAIIATPSALHILSLIPLIKANIPFYIEKPIVTERSQIDQLKSLLEKEKYNATTMVGYNLRFLPSLQILKDGIEKNILGNIVRANFQAGLWLPSWRKTHYLESYSAHSAMGGGVVFDLIHELDMVQWFLGQFDLVHSIVGHFSSLQISSEDVACILLGKKNRQSPVVSVSLDYISRRLVRNYEIVGEEATLRWDLPAKKIELISPESCSSIDCGKNGFDVQKTYIVAMQEFLLSVLEKKQCSLDIWEGLKSAELALQVMEAGSR